MVARWSKSGISVLQIVRYAQAELADYGRPVATAVIDARLLEIGCWGLAGSGVIDAVIVGPFEVAVVVVSGEPVVW